MWIGLFLLARLGVLQRNLRMLGEDGAMALLAMIDCLLSMLDRLRNVIFGGEGGLRREKYRWAESQGDGCEAARDHGWSSGGLIKTFFNFHGITL
jgi:hypothetical protein